MNSLFDEQEVTVGELLRRVEALEAIVMKNEQPGRTAPPLWVPEPLRPAWARWDAFRKVRKGWTADAKRVNLAKLVDLTPPSDPSMADKIVQQSIERGWTGLFPLKEDERQQAAPKPKYQTAAEALSAGEDKVSAKLGWLRQQHELGALTDDQYRAECRKVRG